MRRCHQRALARIQRLPERIGLRIRGAIRGFVAEIGSVAAFVAGFGGAILFYKSVSLLIEKWFGPSMWNPLIAFLILFVLLYLLVKLLERLLAAVFDKSVADKDIPIVGYVIAPRKTPDDVVNVLEKALAKACTEPELLNGMAKSGGAVDFYDGKTGAQNLLRIMERVKAMQQ
jgi:hypothetical protein